MKDFLCRTVLLGALVIGTAPLRAESAADTFQERFQAALNAAQRPDAPATPLPFGEARLLFAQTGVRGAGHVLAGLQVATDSQWFLTQPRITAAAPTASAIETPLPLLHPLPAGQTRTAAYAGTVVFPIVASLKTNQEDFVLTAQATLTACLKEQPLSCLTETLVLGGTLPAGENYATAWEAHLVQALQFVPVPAARASVEAQASLQDGGVRLDFSFPHAVKEIDIQIDNPLSFTVLQKQIHGKSARLLLAVDPPPAVGNALFLKILTPRQWYDAPTAVREQTPPLPPPAAPLPWGVMIFGGVLLFFFSPLWWFFWLPPHPSAKGLKESAGNLREAGLATAAAAALFAALGWWASPAQTLPPWALFLLMGGLAWKPRWGIPMTLVWTLLLPKPYLESALAALSGRPLALAMTVIFWSLCALHPFMFWRLSPRAFQKLHRSLQKQAPRHIRMIAIFPLVILMGWVAVGGLAPRWAFPEAETFTLARREAALSEGKTVVVSLTRNICARCFWNRAVWMNAGAWKQLRANHSVAVFSLDIAAPLGQELALQTGLDTVPFYVIYTRDNHEIAVAGQDYASLAKILKKLLEKPAPLPTF